MSGAIEDGLGDNGAGGAASTHDHDVCAMKAHAFFRQRGGDAVGVGVIADHALAVKADGVDGGDDLGFRRAFITCSEGSFFVGDGDIGADRAEGAQPAQRRGHAAGWHGKRQIGCVDAALPARRCESAARPNDAPASPAERSAWFPHQLLRAFAAWQPYYSIF